MNISVIVPSYNRSDLLARALESVQEQTRPPDEIIVVDDGSTDSTESTVRQHFPDVRYVGQENRGVSAARNLGIREARGDWIAFLDSDDRWLPKKLEIQLDALSRDPAAKICHTEEIWIRRGRRVNPRKKHAKSGGWIFQRCLPLCAMSPSSIVIHKSVFEDYGDFDETLTVCEDYDLWLRITSRLPVIFIEEPFIEKYGGHDDQLSKSEWGMDRFRIRALEKIIAADHLRPDDLRAACQTLVEKIDIFILGAEKRGKTAELDSYRDLREAARSKML